MVGTLDEDGWTLENISERAERDPLFVAPDPNRLAAVAPGARVALMFIFELGDGSIEGERLWLTVVDQREGAFLGTLEEGPLCSDALGAGDVVPFALDHVAAIGAPPDTEP